MIIAVVQFMLQTPVSKEEAYNRAETTAPLYRDIDGLLNKQYLWGEDGLTVGGVYLWNSREEAEACYNDEWRQRLANKYETDPMISWYDCPVLLDNRHGEIISGK